MSLLQRVSNVKAVIRWWREAASTLCYIIPATFSFLSLLWRWAGAGVCEQLPQYISCAVGFSTRQQLSFLTRLSFRTKRFFFFFAKFQFDPSPSLNPKHLKIKWLDSESHPLFKPFWQQNTGTKDSCLLNSPKPPFRSHWQRGYTVSWLRMSFSSHPRSSQYFNLATEILWK